MKVTRNKHQPEWHFVIMKSDVDILVTSLYFQYPEFLTKYVISIYGEDRANLNILTYYSHLYIAKKHDDVKNVLKPISMN